MDKLTLEILSAYLPWGLKVQHTFEDKTQILIVMGIHDDGGRIRNENEEDYDPEFSLAVCYKEHHKYRPHGYFYIQKNFKPLLRPLSIQFLTSVFPDANDLEDVLLAIEQDKLLQIRHDLFTELVKNHGDVFGLIERGLAVEIKEGV